jgi:hypothetical protein
VLEELSEKPSEEVEELTLSVNSSHGAYS